MPNAIPGMTVATPTVATAVVVTPEYIRLPGPGEHDQLFGLTRSYLNLLILPRKDNDFRPPVRSSVLRQPRAKTGVRLVNVASLRHYLKSQLEPQEGGPMGSSVANADPELPSLNPEVEFLRLPKTEERDPLFGLSRTFLNQLILPSVQNGYRPLVRSHVLRRRGYRTGIRLISVDSLRGYIKAHEEPNSGPPPVGPEPSAARPPGP